MHIRVQCTVHCTVHISVYKWTDALTFIKLTRHSVRPLQAGNKLIRLEQLQCDTVAVATASDRSASKGAIALLDDTCNALHLQLASAFSGGRGQPVAAPGKTPKARVAGPLDPVTRPTDCALSAALTCADESRGSPSARARLSSAGHAARETATRTHRSLSEGRRAPPHPKAVNPVRAYNSTRTCGKCCHTRDFILYFSHTVPLTKSGNTFN